MKKITGLIGEKFHRWTVIEEGFKLGTKLACLCRCECGVERAVNQSSLVNGKSKSCGCLSRETTVAYLTNHGMTNTRIFSIWKGMLTRCNNPNSKSWTDYGGRGIKVSEAWNDFQVFYAEMGPSYGDDLTIDRIDNELGYQAGNCRWIPRAEQNKNRRNVIYVDTEQGKMSIAEAARVAGVSWFCIENRHKKKWPIEKMLTPSRERKING